MPFAPVRVGLRRALGARRRDIATQFLVEAGLLGTVGGLVGTAIGVSTVISIAVANQWTAVIPPVETFSAPFIGGAIGLLAAVYPAFRAASIEPVRALQR